ncbi:twin-arginine translocation pathway signal [Pseudomonas sp. CF161]|nr:twin-arginine translocation pathway signal [Pseudomonas sp. CF161]
MVLLFAVACGLAVGNVYYAQPLLDAMGQAFGMPAASVGGVVSLTQVGYGLGLLLLVPLGDLLNRRRLIVGQTLLSVVALLVVALAPSSTWLLLGMACCGLLAVVTQVLVAYAANLAAPHERGRVVGMVTSGIVIGILLARTVSGSMADLAGWRSVYLLSAGLTLLMAVLLWRVLPKTEQVDPLDVQPVSRRKGPARPGAAGDVDLRRRHRALDPAGAAPECPAAVAVPHRDRPVRPGWRRRSPGRCPGRSLGGSRLGAVDQRPGPGPDAGLLAAHRVYPVLTVGAAGGRDHFRPGLAGGACHQPEPDLQRAP